MTDNGTLTALPAIPPWPYEKPPWQIVPREKDLAPYAEQFDSVMHYYGDANPKWSLLGQRPAALRHTVQWLATRVDTELHEKGIDRNKFRLITIDNQGTILGMALGMFLDIPITVVTKKRPEVGIDLGEYEMNDVNGGKRQLWLARENYDDLCDIEYAYLVDDSVGTMKTAEFVRRAIHTLTGGKLEIQQLIAMLDITVHPKIETPMEYHPLFDIVERQRT